MRPPLLLILIAVASINLVSCRDLGSGLECPPAPVLAADQDLQIALSCIEIISFEGSDYFVDCFEIHPSRVGAQILTGGGETRFTGARKMNGIPPHHGLIVLGGHCPEGLATIAVSDEFSRLDAGLLQVSTKAQHELRRAREKRPWIVPGLNQVPDVLELEAHVDDSEIVITNLNNFPWKACSQVQIGDQIDAVWEAAPFKSLEPGASHRYQVSAFGYDAQPLYASQLANLSGQPVIVMCRAPQGIAQGEAPLG